MCTDSPEGFPLLFSRWLLNGVETPWQTDLNNFRGPGIFRMSGPNGGRQAAKTPTETSTVVQNPGADTVLLSYFG